MYVGAVEIRCLFGRSGRQNTPSRYSPHGLQHIMMSCLNTLRQHSTTALVKSWHSTLWCFQEEKTHWPIIDVKPGSNVNAIRFHLQTYYLLFSTLFYRSSIYGEGCALCLVFCHCINVVSTLILLVAMNCARTRQTNSAAALRKVHLPHRFRVQNIWQHPKDVFSSGSAFNAFTVSRI